VNVRAWLTQSVAVATVTGRNSHGDPTFGSQRTVTARVEPLVRLLRKPNGEEVYSSHSLLTDQAIAMHERIWLPGTNPADNTAARVPLEVRVTPSKVGDFSLYQVLL
jgi:hypothetical protein